MIESESRRRSEPGGERGVTTVDIEQPPAASQLEKWEPRGAAPSAPRPADHAAQLANSVEDESQASSSLASSSDYEVEEMVERETGPSPEGGRPYLAALEALGTQLSNGGPEPNSVNIGNNIIKDTNSVHVGPLTVNKFLGNFHIGTLTYANPAADPDRIEKQAEAEASEPRPKLSTTSDHPFFPLSQTKVAEWLWTRKCIVGIIVAAVLLIVVAVLAVVLSTGRLDPPDTSSSANDSSITTDYGDVPIVRRSEWGALPAKEVTKLEILPPEYVIIAHTAGPFCTTKDQCIEVMRKIQEDHVWVQHWSDIGYNFLVGGDGRVYEGLGWDVEGSHSYGWNKKSIGIAFTGDYRFDVPTQDQIDAVTELMELGVKQNKLQENYKVLAHLQVAGMISPGANLFNVIKTWKHWSKCPNVSERKDCST